MCLVVISILKDSLTIIHFNVGSLQKNFDAFHEFLCNQPCSPDIICVTETRFNKNQPLLNIDISGYTFIHIDSPTTAGGVAMYINNALQFSVITNLQLTVNECENIWIKLHDSNVIISTIYRHPKNDAQVFIDALNTNLEKVRNNKVFLVGDFNLNIKPLPDSKFPDRHASKYIDMLISNGYYPLINVPTRVTDNLSTIIDHIVTNDHTHNILPGVIKTDLTDHCPIFCTISNLKLKKSHKPTFRRDFSMFNADYFCNHLNNEINSFFLTISYIDGNNFDAIFDHFPQLLTNAITLYAPMRKLTRKQQKLINKPWISRGILKSIKTKQKFYLTHFVNGNLEQKQLYKNYANKLTKVKFAAKKLYYQDKLETSKNNTAEVWRIVKSLLSFSRSDANLPQKLRHNNTFTTNPTLIANNFNDYFSDIGKILADQLKPISENEHTKYLTKRFHQSLFLTPTTSFEVFNLISGPKNTKSTGKDNISAYFLKVAAKVIAAPLAQLFNYTFLLGIFPASLKIAKIIPIYKSGDKTDVSNYRPISILSPISKILEKLIHVRTINFFNKHSVLLPTQYGFRANHSTSHALTDVLTSLYDNINDEKYTALLLLDLKKAFDTVNHKTLLTKLEHYGIRGPTLDLFASFLTNRFQYVSLENHQSNLKKINYGVPQGSVLGPLLFTFILMILVPVLLAPQDCLLMTPVYL